MHVGLTRPWEDPVWSGFLPFTSPKSGIRVTHLNNERQLRRWLEASRRRRHRRVVLVVDADVPLPDGTPAAKILALADKKAFPGIRAIASAIGPERDPDLKSLMKGSSRRFIRLRNAETFPRRLRRLTA